MATHDLDGFRFWADDGLPGTNYCKQAITLKTPVASTILNRMAFGTRKLLQAASCLICVVLAQRNSFGIGGTEFSGGRLTGPILDSLEIGSLLFVLALRAYICAPTHRCSCGYRGFSAQLAALPLLHCSRPFPSSVWRGLLSSAAGKFCLGQERDFGRSYSRSCDVHLHLESAVCRAPAQ